MKLNILLQISKLLLNIFLFQMETLTGRWEPCETVLFKFVCKHFLLQFHNSQQVQFMYHMISNFAKQKWYFVNHKCTNNYVFYAQEAN